MISRGAPALRSAGEAARGAAGRRGAVAPRRRRGGAREKAAFAGQQRHLARGARHLQAWVDVGQPGQAPGQQVGRCRGFEMAFEDGGEAGAEDQAHLLARVGGVADGLLRRRQARQQQQQQDQRRSREPALPAGRVPAGRAGARAGPPCGVGFKRPGKKGKPFGL